MTYISFKQHFLSMQGPLTPDPLSASAVVIPPPPPAAASAAAHLIASAAIPDETLAQLSVKELNKRVQNFPREDVVALKQRRRTLKNRG